MSDDTPFTPGPWGVRFDHDQTGYPCYFIHGFAGDQKRDVALHAANARLIAAAPDLLAALRSLAHEARGFHAMASPEAHGQTNLRCLERRIDEAFVALAKAEGGPR